jgi:hypothetical protein
MTAGAVVDEARQVDADRNLRRARQLLGRAQLELRPGVDEAQAAALLARVLHRHDPFASEHGRLLLAALRARPPAEKLAGPRPPVERIIRRLLANEQAPTPKAVTAELERAEAHARARAAHVARVAPIVQRDGGCAAEVIAGHWRRRGTGPTVPEVARALNWPWRDTRAIVAGMVEAGWLTTGEGARSLRPGPRATEAAIAGSRR